MPSDFKFQPTFCARYNAFVVPPSRQGTSQPVKKSARLQINIGPPANARGESARCPGSTKPTNKCDYPNNFVFVCIMAKTTSVCLPASAILGTVNLCHKSSQEKWRGKQPIDTQQLPSSTTTIGRRALDTRHLKELDVLPSFPNEIFDCSKVTPLHLRALPSEFGPSV